jgi:alkylmercury lyase
VADKTAERKFTVDDFAGAISAAMPKLDLTDQQINYEIHQLMSSGEPVDPAVVATNIGVPAELVNARLDSWPGVYRDPAGRVAGFWGQAVEKLEGEAEYRFLVDGKTTYAWCALDTLFIPKILDKTVRVEASDPVTGEPVTLVVHPDGVRNLQPAGAVVSMVVPDAPFGYDVIEAFCSRVFFFASQATGAKWAAEHPGTTILSVDDAFKVGLAATERSAPDLFGKKG